MPIMITTIPMSETPIERGNKVHSPWSSATDVPMKAPTEPMIQPGMNIMENPRPLRRTGVSLAIIDALAAEDNDKENPYSKKTMMKR